MKFIAPVLWLLVGWVVLMAAIALFQDRLLYLPARATVAQMSSSGLAAWPSAQDFRGLVAEPAEPGGKVRGTAVVFHGNAGHAGHRTHYADALTALGLRVILAEYPGYGPRDGSVGEASLVADAVQTLALAHRLHGAPLLVIGESPGAGVAAAASAQAGAQVAALVLITPWDRLEHVAAHRYPWLPVRWLLRDRYDSAAHLATFDGPVWVAVAERDTIVPARFGTALHASLPGRKRLDVMLAAGHNDWLLRVDGAWWSQAVTFALGDASR
ncbi:MAG: alpha/beta hydrolase [Methylibium sp. NZG]|nr:MAG: alpha/beta hydrolase [Methylibium sp. NZG]